MSRLLLAVAVAVLWAAAPVVGAARPGRVRLTATVPSVARAGTPSPVAGRAAGAPAGSVAELERQTAPRRWAVLAATGVRAGRFTLRWTPTLPGFFDVRVVVVRHGALLARTGVRPVLVGAAPVYCAAPAGPVALPPGAGRIVGGVYNEGGPAPGIYVCQGQANAVTLSRAGGAPVAMQEVAAGQSYSFVVPAGTYTLSSGYCRGSASVGAGQTTTADTVCPVP